MRVRGSALGVDAGLLERALANDPAVAAVQTAATEFARAARRALEEGGSDVATTESVLRERDRIDSDALGDPAQLVDSALELCNGRIDLGALTAEFLALGLDPYPRKPGVAFEPHEEAAEKPLAALHRLKGREG